MKAKFKVVIPTSAYGLIALSKGIVSKHKSNPAESPLRLIAMDEFEQKVLFAEQKHQEFLDLSKAAEEAREARDLALGKGDAQNRYTAGTVLYFVTSARDVLVGTFRGAERKLGAWGLKVDNSTKSVRPLNDALSPPEEPDDGMDNIS